MTLGGVSATAVLTLRARADEHRRPDGWFQDPVAAAWSEALPWPAALERWYTPFAQVKTALRAHQIDRMVQALLTNNPRAVVVELGAGFSTRVRRLGCGSEVTWLELDLPEVMAARAALPEGAGPARLLSCSVLDRAWLEEVPDEPGAQVILLAEGLLYYLPEAEVQAFLTELRGRFPGAALIFDVIGASDFGRSQAISRRAGAPILWAVRPPFEAAQAALGLELIPGLEPQRILDETVAGFGARYGPLLGFGLTQGARIGWFRDRRSGLMAGRLSPPP
ncbi:MAG: class I SAM-dependent methyltransferase [Deltaproteobacteria bacterium]|nr:class I SAM-dependent methyltransferase [Deltaproteobacteria bacterium]